MATMSIPRYSPAEAKDAVDRFNARNPVGSGVVVLRDTGEEFVTYTRTRAWIADSGAPVVMLARIAGYYHIARVEPLGAPAAGDAEHTLATNADGLRAARIRDQR